LTKKVIPDLETQPILWILANHPDPKQWAELGTEKLLTLMAAAKLPKRSRRAEVVQGLVEVARSFTQNLPQAETNCLLSEVRMLARRLEHLVADVKEAESLLECFSAEDKQMQLVDSLKGAGPVTSAQILGEIQDIANFASESKLASYAGQALATCQTGKSYNYKRPQVKANRRLKCAFMQLAFNNCKWDPRSKAYVEKKEADGKTPVQARRCLARHLVRVVYSMLRKSEPNSSPN
jgi:transposase